MAVPQKELIDFGKMIRYPYEVVESLSGESSKVRISTTSKTSRVKEKALGKILGRFTERIPSQVLTPDMRL